MPKILKETMLKELKYTNNDSNILQSNGNYELKGAIKVKNLLEELNIAFKLTKEIISKQRDNRDYSIFWTEECLGNLRTPTCLHHLHHVSPRSRGQAADQCVPGSHESLRITFHLPVLFGLSWTSHDGRKIHTHPDSCLCPHHLSISKCVSST